MKEFVKTDDFKAMNLGFALDEGMQDLFIFCIIASTSNNIITEQLYIMAILYNL